MAVHYWAALCSAAGATPACLAPFPRFPQLYYNTVLLYYNAAAEMEGRDQSYFEKLASDCSDEIRLFHGASLR